MRKTILSCRPTSEAIWPPRHGSILIDKNLRIYQTVSLPTFEELAVVIVKYKPCSSGPWTLSTSRLCRVQREYSAADLRATARRVGVRLQWDPLFETWLPALGLYEVLYSCDPLESAKVIESSPSGMLEEKFVSVAGNLAELGVPADSIGVTGTLAAGMEIDGISDIDIVIYGDEAAERVFECFKLLPGTSYNVRKERVGGINVDPPLNLGWRRRIVEGTHISWIAAPPAACLHCKKLRELRRLIASPRRVASVEVLVPPRQTGALLYPPCVESVEGRTIVSFEYNLAYYFYRGGRMKIKGLEIEDVIILGAVEYPGFLKLLGR